MSALHCYADPASSPGEGSCFSSSAEQSALRAG